MDNIVGGARPGIVNYNNHADLAGALIDYDITNDGQFLNLARAKAKLEDPHHDGT